MRVWVNEASLFEVLLICEHGHGLSVASFSRMGALLDFKKFFVSDAVSSPRSQSEAFSRYQLSGSFAVTVVAVFYFFNCTFDLSEELA